jgi:hypothetical protein
MTTGLWPGWTDIGDCGVRIDGEKGRPGHYKPMMYQEGHWPVYKPLRRLLG